MGDSGGRGSHQHLGFGEFRADDFGEARLDMAADDRGRQGQPVVAVDRAFDAARPGERLFGAQEYRADRQQVFSNFLLHLT